MKILHRLRKTVTRAVWLVAYLFAGMVVGPWIGWISYQHETRSGFLK